MITRYAPFTIFAVLLISANASAQPAAGEDDLAARMAAYYEPVTVPAFTPAAPQTPLPLDPGKTANWRGVGDLVPKGAAQDLLRKNGFVVFDGAPGRHDKVEQFYDDLKKRGLPVFITSDSLLHLYHIQFGETLRQIEEEQFHDDLKALTVAMLANTEAASRGKLLPRDALANRLLMGYFAVAGRLLDDNAAIPKDVEKEVQAELALIEQHTGFEDSSLFKYKEDYSQYVPRGHYTRSETLKRYFKAMMWYGRMAFLIKGKDAQIQNALISEEEAKVQTLAAFLIADMLTNVDVPPGRKAEEVWKRIYAITAYYVGFADDLTPGEYTSALDGMKRKREQTPAMVIDENWFSLQKTIASLRAPEIYGGTGAAYGPPPAIATPADLDKALAATQGMRLMGQRYVPDSYIMGKLVYPSVGKFTGQGQPFTLVQSQGGPVRGFPRGLDVMAVLDATRIPWETNIHSVHSVHTVHAVGDGTYERYYNILDNLARQFRPLSDAAWNRNMYWSWLNSLRALLGPEPEGYPSFMRADAWQDKQLNTALGSWAQLRHDTILYAKQSYTMGVTSMPMQPRMVEGYVEPVPEFYARLLALTRMTRKGLEDMKALGPQAKQRVTALEGIVERLLDISVRELKNEKLSEQDYAFIRAFGDSLKAAVAGVDKDGLETAIVADVHTDSNTMQVLEEGTGYLRTIAVAYPMPDGGTVIGFGPVFSYYEFKQPANQRLTDEAWKKLLESPNPPKRPEWVKSFAAE